MTDMKLTVDQQKELIGDDEIHAAFLERPDISLLPPEEQEAKWQTQLEGVNRFREWLTSLDSCVVTAPSRQNNEKTVSAASAADPYSATATARGSTTIAPST